MKPAVFFSPIAMTFGLAIICLAAMPLAGQEANQPAYQTTTIDSTDGLKITADFYQADGTSNKFIVMCHQAGWSRGEYREIAPKFQKAGFHCLAIDQRSGKKDLYNKVTNDTALAAAQAGKPTEFTDAEQDIVAALKWVRAQQPKAKVFLWGSSYSAALALRIAGERPELVDGVLAFAPGEYFERFGKPAIWIETSARKIKAPAFITSARNEVPNWQKIYDAIPGQKKENFIPTTKGNHGSRALFKRFEDSEAYWAAVNKFFQTYANDATGTGQ